MSPSASGNHHALICWSPCSLHLLQKFNEELCDLDGLPELLIPVAKLLIEISRVPGCKRTPWFSKLVSVTKALERSIEMVTSKRTPLTLKTDLLKPKSLTMLNPAFVENFDPGQLSLDPKIRQHQEVRAVNSCTPCCNLWLTELAGEKTAKGCPQGEARCGERVEEGLGLHPVS